MSCTGLGSPLTCTYKQTPLLKTRFESCQGLNCWGGFLETLKKLGDEDQDFHGISGTFGFTLQGTNISPKNGILKMIFLFPRWDMLIPWRVHSVKVWRNKFCFKVTYSKSFGGDSSFFFLQILDGNPFKFRDRRFPPFFLRLKMWRSPDRHPVAIAYRQEINFLLSLPGPQLSSEKGHLVIQGIDWWWKLLPSDVGIMNHKTSVKKGSRH